MLVMLPLAWLFLCLPLFGKKHARYEAAGAVVKDALAKLGRISTPEIRIGAVFGTTALLWICREPLNKLPGLDTLTDTGIAIFGALLLFFIPSGRGGSEKLIDWPTAERIPWGIAILFGGGLSLAGAMGRRGSRNGSARRFLEWTRSRRLASSRCW
jgi:sodium-dependent dicarboxylate transporter 2/3/5